jgi:hypothetical protein
MIECAGSKSRVTCCKARQENKQEPRNGENMLYNKKVPISESALLVIDAKMPSR